MTDDIDLGEPVEEIEVLGEAIPVHTSNGVNVLELTPRVIVHDSADSWTFAHLATFDLIGDPEFAAQNVDRCVKALRDVAAVDIIFVVEESAFQGADAVAVCISRKDKVRTEE